MKWLNDIQKKLNAPKNEYNSFWKYAYRSAEWILEAVKPLLWDCVLIVSDEVVEVWNRIYVKATATLKSKDEEISTTAFAREPEIQKGMNEAQITWSTSSYARKYALNWLFAIDDTKDTDSTNTHWKNKNTEKDFSNEIYVFKATDIDTWEWKIYWKSIYLNWVKKTISDEQINKLKAHNKYVELPSKK